MEREIRSIISELNKMVGNDKKEDGIEFWMVERVREMLKANGKLDKFEPCDMDQNELREKWENIARSRRLHDADFSITHERFGRTRGSRLIWDEVMKDGD